MITSGYLRVKSGRIKSGHQSRLLLVFCFLRRRKDRPCAGARSAANSSRHIGAAHAPPPSPRYRAFHAPTAPQATRLLRWKPRRTRGNLPHRSAQQSPEPRFNPERRQRGDGSHLRPLRRVAEVVRRGCWRTATARVLEPPRRPAAKSPASTPAVVDAPAAASPGRAAASRRRRKKPAGAVLTAPHPLRRCFVAPPRMTAASRL